nr:putative uncharacterized protein DDB_G0287265 [Dermatophagoides pteronyssinus]
MIRRSDTDDNDTDDNDSDDYSDDEEDDDNDDDDRAESNRDEIMLDDDDDNRNNNNSKEDDDDDDVDRDDFGDNGETQQIDSEIIMPQIFLWNNPVETLNDDSDELTGEKDDDFNLDETQFDQEYPDMLDPQASSQSSLETSASEINQTLQFQPNNHHSNPNLKNNDDNQNVDQNNKTTKIEEIVAATTTGETIIIK